VRLIQLTAAHAGPTDAKVWMNSDKIVKVDERKNVTRIYHEPYDQVAQSLDYTDVEESPEDIARQMNQPLEVSLGSEPVDIAITEWPRGRLSINS
jgi:hypothetical protein